MVLVFLLPGIQGIPSGGNRYNAELIRRLTPATCRPVVWGTAAAAEPWPADAVVLVDSLLAVDQVALDAIVERAGPRRIALIAHYLPQCDPSQPGCLPLPSCFDRYVVPSLFMQRCLIQSGIDSGSITVAYPGVEPTVSGRVRRSWQTPRLLTVASLLPVKGLIEAFDALVPLSNRDWQWDIVGDDSLDRGYSQRLTEAISSSALAGRVRLLGPIPHVEVRWMYAAADMLLAPSRFESLGLAIREAMTAGLPVVAFDVGGVGESVVHERTGLLAPAGDVGAFGAATSRLLDDPMLRQRLGGAARAVSRSFPRWDHTAAAILQMLDHHS